MSGGYGNDRFEFGPGSGLDTVVDSHGDTGSIAFTHASQARNDLWLSHDQGDLVIDWVGAHDRIVVDNWFSAGHQPIDSIELANGDHLDAAGFALLVQAMSAFSVPAGAEDLGSDARSAMEPVIAASWDVA